MSAFRYRRLQRRLVPTTIRSFAGRFGLEDDRTMDKKMKQANIKILRRGDQVINVWGDGAAIRVAVRHKNGEVDLYLLTPDEQGLPRISSDRCRITFGDNEVEIISETPETRSPRSSRNSRSAPPVKISTF